jgi:hypothetical protein
MLADVVYRIGRFSLKQSPKKQRKRKADPISKVDIKPPFLKSQAEFDGKDDSSDSPLDESDFNIDKALSKANYQVSSLFLN